MYWRTLLIIVLLFGSNELFASPQSPKNRLTPLGPFPEAATSTQQEWAHYIIYWKARSAKQAALALPQQQVNNLYAQADTASESFSDGGDFAEFEEEFEANKNEVSDPFAGYNRSMTTFNDKLYVWLLQPVAAGWDWAIPQEGRRSINSFFTNLWYPLRLLNNLLQGKLVHAGEETARFVINSTIGIFGLFDPAKDWLGLEAHPEDFGQTLGYWGLGSGPHIVLPFFGPSNLRDSLALTFDWQFDAVTQIEDPYSEYGARAFRVINDTSLHLGEYESLKKDALDLYPFLRDAYEQKRNKDIQE